MVRLSICFQYTDRGLLELRPMTARVISELYHNEYWIISITQLIDICCSLIMTKCMFSFRYRRMR